MKRSSVTGLGVILVLVLAFGAIYAVNPSFFNGLTGSSATTFSISKIIVEPQDSAHIVGNELYGDFWNIVVYVNANDQLAGVILPDGQAGSVTYEGAIKALETGAKVEIKVDPGQPYLLHDLQQKNPIIAPVATGGGQTVSERRLDYFDWSNAWQIYTPFTVSIYKDGSLVGTKEIDMKGVNPVETIPTNEGTVRIEGLGLLGNDYLYPNMPSQIAILNDNGAHIYDWAQIQSMVDGTSAGSVAGSSATKYADYWYGISRNSNNQAYNPTVVIGTLLGNLYAPSNYGGWMGADYGGNAQPVRPVIFTGEESTLPSGKGAFLCLTEWLQSKNIQNLASTIFKTRAMGDANSIWQSMSFIKDSNNNPTAIRLDVPWGAFGTPLVNIRVPTELADTWIEQPIITNTQVSAVWESTGTTNCDIYGSNRIVATVTNLASVTGSARLTIESANNKLSVTPLSMTVNNLVPNVPQTVYFDAANLGVTDQISSIPITITAYETYANTETSHTTLYATLKPTLNPGITTLNLQAVEKGTSIPIPTLQLSVQYSNQAPTVFTDANGGVTMTLANPQGGAYTGQVTVTSIDTDIYKTHTETYTINNPTAYNFVFEVERKDTDYPDDWIIYVLIAAIIATVIAIIGIAVYMKKHGKRGKRKIA